MTHEPATSNRVAASRKVSRKIASVNLNVTMEPDSFQASSVVPLHAIRLFPAFWL
jgi:hypothetical protein